MTKRLLFTLLAAVTLAACTKKDRSDCATRLCTMEFAMVTIKFTDQAGNGVILKNYNAVNQRTKDTIDFPPNAHILFEEGTYIVASDNQVRALAETGDDIKVSGLDSVSNQTKTALVKVAGGSCACHVSKLAGPAEVKFDR